MEVKSLTFEFNLCKIGMFLVHHPSNLFSRTCAFEETLHQTKIEATKEDLQIHVIIKVVVEETQQLPSQP